MRVAASRSHQSLSQSCSYSKCATGPKRDKQANGNDRVTTEKGLNQGRKRYLWATCVMASLDSEALQTLPGDSNLQLGLKIISPNTHTLSSFFLSLDEHCSFLFKTCWVYHIIKNSEIPFTFSVFAPNSTPLSCIPSTSSQALPFFLYCYYYYFLLENNFLLPSVSLTALSSLA